MGNALIELPNMRRVAGIELINDRNHDVPTILTFHHLLEKHDLIEQIFETGKVHLHGRGKTMRQGTIVDTTLIGLPVRQEARRESGIRRCIRPGRATSCITALWKAAPSD